MDPATHALPSELALAFDRDRHAYDLESESTKREEQALLRAEAHALGVTDSLAADPNLHFCALVKRELAKLSRGRKSRP